LTDDRIMKLEQKQDLIFKELKELNKGLATLISMQRDVDRLGNDVHTLRERSHEYGNRLAQLNFHEEKITRLTWRADQQELGLNSLQDKHGDRLHKLEEGMPLLNLASGWVFKAALMLMALGSVGNVLVALLHIGGA